MSGSIKDLSFNGIPFNVPGDTELEITKGGTVSSEHVVYNKGKTRGIDRITTGMIDGIIVDLDDDTKYDSLLDLASKASVDVAFTDASNIAYGGAGKIIAASEEGIKKNTMNGNVSEAFKVVAVNGKFDKL